MASSFIDWEGTCLAHHGIKGQKWGQRRWQNEDGTLTSAGRAHYGVGEGGKKTARQFNRQMKKLNRLADKANMDYQAARSDKFSRRAMGGMLMTYSSARSLSQPNHSGMQRSAVQQRHTENRLRAARMYTRHSIYQAIKAEHLMTPKGHEKAVQKGRDQIEKMLGQFKGTQYEELVKKKQKKLKLA